MLSYGCTLWPFCLSKLERVYVFSKYEYVVFMCNTEIKLWLSTISCWSVQTLYRPSANYKLTWYMDHVITGKTKYDYSICERWERACAQLCEHSQPFYRIRQYKYLLMWFTRCAHRVQSQGHHHTSFLQYIAERARMHVIYVLLVCVCVCTHNIIYL